MSRPLPILLFHGTTTTRARSIDREGLRPGRKPRWPGDGHRRYVYMTEHPRAALGWADSGRRTVKPVVYFVDVDALDVARLEVDPADPTGECGGLWRYRGRISCDALVRCVVTPKRDRTVVTAERMPQLVAGRIAEYTAAMESRVQE